MVETRRQQIDSVAGALFRERGYAATSVRDIAQRSGIQGASLYAHVASKEDVLWSIVQGAARRFHDAASAVSDHTDLTAADRLRRMIQAHVAVVTDDLGQASVFLHEWRHLSDNRRAVILAARDAYERRFRQVIEDGQRRGGFATVEAGLVTRAILDALNGICGWYRPDGRSSPSQIADHYAELFIHALKSTPEDPP